MKEMEFTLMKAFSLCIVIVMMDSIVPQRIVRPRAQLKEELRELFNGGGALSDFVFFDLEELHNYTKINGSPRNRTQLLRKNRKKPKKQDPIANTLARTQKQYSRGNNTDLISNWAKVLHTLLYNKDIPNFKKHPLLTQFNALVSKNERILENSTTRDVNDYERKRRQLTDGEQKPNVRNKRELIDENHLALLPKSPVQTIDHERMRRSIQFSYVGVEKCDEEGSVGTIQNTILLCKTCFKTVDFGLYIIPRYANSIECDDSFPSCVDGHGTCTQKVVYYTFQKVVDTITNSWVPFKQPLNVSCECECYSGSVIHTGFVGNSN